MSARAELAALLVLGIGVACSSKIKHTADDDKPMDAGGSAGASGSPGDSSTGGGASVGGGLSTGGAATGGGGSVGGSSGASSGGAASGGGSGGGTVASGGSSATGGGTSASGGTSGCEPELGAQALDVGSLACVQTRIVNVINRGDEAVEVVPQDPAHPLAYTGGLYPGTRGTCRTFISAKEVCDLEIDLLPGEPFGAFEERVELDYRGRCGDSTLGIPVSGTLLRRASLSVAPSPAEFGPTESSEAGSVTLTNDGEVAASFLEPFAGAGPFDYSGGSFPGTGDCSTQLQPKDSCDVGLTFSPTQTALERSVMALDYDDGCSKQTLDIALEGRGRTSVGISPSGATLDLGTRNCPSSGGNRTWTVTNEGNLPVTDIVVTLEGDAAFSILSDGCSPTLAAGDDCNVTVRHSRSCSLPNFSDEATLTIAYNDGQPQSFSVFIELFWYGCDSC